MVGEKSDAAGLVQGVVLQRCVLLGGRDPGVAVDVGHRLPALWAWLLGRSVDERGDRLDNLRLPVGQPGEDPGVVAAQLDAGGRGGVGEPDRLWL